MAVRVLRRNWTTWLLGLISVVWVLPTLWTYYETFRSARGAFTTSALSAAWTSAPFPEFGLNTLIIVFGLFSIQALLGAVSGFVLAKRKFALKRFFFFVFLLQIVIPIYALMVPDYQVLKSFHLLNTLSGIMLPYVASGIAVLSFYQAFRSVPIEIEEAARLDGCGAVGLLRHVYLPFAAPALMAFAVLSVSYHWTDFLWPLIVTSSNHARPLVVGLAMLSQSSESGAQWNLIASATVITTTPILLIFALFSRRIVQAFARTFIM